MRLAYITNIKIPAEDAQSLQAIAMAQVFYKKLKEEFLLISPKNEQNKNLVKDFSWFRLPVLYFLPRSVRYFFTILFSLPVIFKFKPKVIYSRDIGVILFYSLLNFKCVYEIHKPFETFCGNRIFSLIAKKIKIVAISKALKDFIVEKYNLNFENVLIAHDGVLVENFFKPVNLDKKLLKKDLLGVSEDDFVILYSGSVQAGKGIDVIKQLAIEFLDFKNIKFFVVGGLQTEQEYKNIIFLDRKPNIDIPKYLWSADLLILPNTKELKYYKYTSPLKMFEYMASGTPILSSNAGSITEVLNKDNAFLFSADNIVEAVEIINKIVQDYSITKSKAEHSLLDVQKFGWINRAENILDFIEKKYEIKK